MPSNFTSRVITWYDESDNYVTNAIFPKGAIKSFPIFTDTGSGQVNEATLVLNAREGEYIRTADGSSILIDDYDRIGYSITDLGGNTYTRFFEVIDRIPTKSKNKGVHLTLEMLGTEYHTQHVHYVKPHWFTNAFSVAEDIGDLYNANTNAKNQNHQPVLTVHDTAYNGTTFKGNDLPNWTANHYEYGLNEDSCYNRWLDIIDKMGASVSAGGALEFYELGFNTPSVSSIELNLVTSGKYPLTPSSNAVVLKNTDSINVGDNEGQLSIPTGTNVLAWGATTAGTLPIGLAKYNSGIFQFKYRPKWDSTLTYPIGSKVMRAGKHYEQTHSIESTGDDPLTSGSIWTIIYMSTEFGNSVQYSEWTDGSSVLFVNSGCKASAAIGGTPDSDGDVVFVNTSTPTASFFDHNIIIDDGKFFRTWVNDNAISDTTLDALSLLHAPGLTRFTFNRGFRILVSSSSPTATPFTQNAGQDQTGKSYANAVVEFNDGGFTGADEYKNWDVKYALGDLSANVDGAQVASFNDAKVFKWDHATQLYYDISGDDLGNDCFHPWDQIENVAGVDFRPHTTDSTLYPDVTNGTQTFTTNLKSAVKITYNTGAAAIDRVANKELYQAHWIGFNLAFPYPYSIQKSLASTPKSSESVGSIYGGGTLREPATLDTDNMHLTPDGSRGFNHGDQSEAYGQLGSLFMYLRMKRTSIFNTILDGDANFRCILTDTSDNQVSQDFVQRFSDGDVWQPQDLKLSGFNAWRGHKPRYFSLDGNDIADLITPKELDVQNIFEWRNLKFVTVEYLDVYDEFGRFAPEGNIGDIDATGIQSTLGGKIELSVDSLHFKKPLLVSSGEAVDSVKQNVEPSFIQRPHVILYDQLKNDAKTMLEIEQFQHQEYNIKTSGENIFDIKFGDSFYIQDTDIVESGRNDGSKTGAILLVAKRIEYSITKPTTGQGGIVRTIKGVKRFT
jgi:hypothetical protein